MRQPQKMVKRTQTIRRLLPTNCLSVFNHFVRLPLKGLTIAVRILPFKNKKEKWLLYDVSFIFFPGEKSLDFVCVSFLSSDSSFINLEE